MFYVYVLENKKGRKYTGSTDNLKERISFHNGISPEKAKFHRTTYKKGPWELIFYKEFKTRKESLLFEKYLKTGIGRDWLERARRGG
jgi:putative endonuclease